jgi:hypothetical protein
MRVSRNPITQLGLVPRIGIIAAVLIIETLLFSYLIQETAHSSTDLDGVVRGIQHWTFRDLDAAR